MFYSGASGNDMDRWTRDRNFPSTSRIRGNSSSMFGISIQPDSSHFWYEIYISLVDTENELRRISSGRFLYCGVRLTSFGWRSLFFIRRFLFFSSFFDVILYNFVFSFLSVPFLERKGRGCPLRWKSSCRISVQIFMIFERQSVLSF